MSRRTFLKNSAAVAASAASFCKVSRPPSLPPVTMPSRSGLPGWVVAGQGPRIRHSPPMASQAGGCGWNAFWDVIDDQLKQIANYRSKKAERVQSGRRSEVRRGLDAYKQVIDSDIDVVILATPPGFRPIHFAAAVDKGRHVFMEKPVATDPSWRALVLEKPSWRGKNLKVGVGLQRRHEPAYRELNSDGSRRRDRDVIASRVYWNGGGVWEPRRPASSQDRDGVPDLNWYNYNWLCGDHICEQHIHNLDVGNWLKNGFPVSANGMGGREVRTDKRYGEIYDHHAVEYTYADGSKMFSQSVTFRAAGARSTSMPTVPTATIHLQVVAPSSATIEMPNGSRRSSPRPSTTIRIRSNTTTSFKAIRTGADGYNEAEYGAMSTMTRDPGSAVYLLRKWITMEQALNSQVSIMPKEYGLDAEPPVKPNENGEYPIAIPGKSKVVLVRSIAVGLVRRVLRSTGDFKPTGAAWPRGL